MKLLYPLVAVLLVFASLSANASVQSWLNRSTPIRDQVVDNPEPTIVFPRLTFRVPALLGAASAQPAAPKSISSDIVWQLPILMYHYVRVVDAKADPLGYRLSVTPEQFEQQLDWLAANGYHTVDPIVLTAAKPIPPKSVLITFDDGYEDFATNAWPALKAHRAGAIAFITTGFIGKSGYLTPAQVQSLAADGVTIGAHTMSHVNLANQSPTELTGQLVQSKTTLEALIHAPVPWIAYPAGQYNDSVLATTKSAGYTVGMTTHFGLATNLDDHLAFPRIQILGTDSLNDFSRKVQDR